MSDTTGILILESLTSREMSLFYSLFFTDSSYYRKECMICKLSDIRKNSLLYFKDNNEFMSVLISLNRKLNNIFSSYQYMVNLHNETIQINLSKELVLFIMNELDILKSKKQIKVLMELKCKYAKRLYHLILKSNEINRCSIPIEYFIDSMGIPNYYKMGNIDQKVLNPALAELREHLNNLTVDKVKEGRSIVSLQFRWNANTINPISF